MCLLKVEIERNIRNHSAPDVRNDPISRMHAQCRLLWQRLLVQHADNCPSCQHLRELAYEVCDVCGYRYLVHGGNRYDRKECRRPDCSLCA